MTGFGRRKLRCGCKVSYYLGPLGSVSIDWWPCTQHAPTQRADYGRGF